MLAVDVRVVGEREKFGAPQLGADVVLQPVGHDGVPGERSVAHRVASADDRVREVVVGGVAVQLGVAALVPAVLLHIAPAETAREEDVGSVRHDVVPRRALRVRKVRPAHELRRAEVVALPGVRHAHQVVLPGLAHADRIRAAEAGAVHLKALRPVRGRLHLRVEAPRAVEVVERAVRREDVDEDGVRVVARLQELRVAEAPRVERMRRPAVGERVAAGIEPRPLRRAVEVEDDEVVGIVVAIRVDVRIVVVRAEEDARRPARFPQRAERRRVAARRIDFRQAVVVAPALPVVLHEDRVVQPVLRGLGDPLRRLRVVAAPLVEAHPRAEAAEARASAVARHGAEAACRVKGPLRRRDEREERVVVRLQREEVRVAVAHKPVRRHVHGLDDGEPVRVVRAHVARGKTEPARAERELLRPLDHVAETRVDAERPHGGGAHRDLRQAREAAGVARHAGNRPLEAQRPLLLPDLGRRQLKNKGAISLFDVGGETPVGDHLLAVGECEDAVEQPPPAERDARAVASP